MPPAASSLGTHRQDCYWCSPQRLHIPSLTSAVHPLPDPFGRSCRGSHTWQPRRGVYFWLPLIRSLRGQAQKADQTQPSCCGVRAVWLTFTYPNLVANRLRLQTSFAPNNPNVTQVSAWSSFPQLWNLSRSQLHHWLTLSGLLSSATHNQEKGDSFTWESCLFLGLNQKPQHEMDVKPPALKRHHQSTGLPSGKQKISLTKSCSSATEQHQLLCNKCCTKTVLNHTTGTDHVAAGHWESQPAQQHCSHHTNLFLSSLPGKQDGCCWKNSNQNNLKKG